MYIHIYHILSHHTGNNFYVIYFAFNKKTISGLHTLNNQHTSKYRILNKQYYILQYSTCTYIIYKLITNNRKIDVLFYYVHKCFIYFEE